MRSVLSALALLALAVLGSGCDSRKAYPVRSTPSGAEVLMDGKVVGVTPTSLFLDTRKEEHVVVLRRAGYTAVERRVLSKPLLEGPTRNCTVVICRPVGARVYVDGILVAQAEPVREESVQGGVRVSYPTEEGVATIPLEAKVVRLEIRAEGYVTHESQVLIRSREYVRLRLNLLPREEAARP